MPVGTDTLARSANQERVDVERLEAVAEP